MSNSETVPSRSRLEINQAALNRNLATICNHVAPTKVLAVLKADGYGLGAKLIASALNLDLVSAFGVAEVARGLELHEFGKLIHIMGAVLPDECEVAIKKGFLLPISSIESAKYISATAEALAIETKVQLKIDTGMGRLGLFPDEIDSALNLLSASKFIKVTGIYSHFPSAYNNPDYSNNQVVNFRAIIDRLSRKGVNFELIHIANSDGIHNVPGCIKPPFNLVRTGINLYGLFDLEGQRAFQLEPALELKAKLVSIRPGRRGMTIGYGQTYQLDRDLRLGVVGVGYADGVPLGLSNNGHFLINGITCPIIGRISMDFTVVSLENVPSAQIGDDVTCLGGPITVQEWAKAKKSNSYEIICGFGPRVKRKLV